MGSITGMILKIAGYLLIAVFVVMTLIQIFLPDMMFTLVSMRNRRGRKLGNILFVIRNAVIYLIPGILCVILSGYVAGFVAGLMR